MNKKWLVISTAAAVVVAFIAGAAFLRERSTQEVVQAAQTNNDAFVRPHSPVPLGRGCKVPANEGAADAVIDLIRELSA